jgi:hypothetical protein
MQVSAMSEHIPKHRQDAMKMKKRARTRAYAMLLEETETALEILYNDTAHYVIGVDETLYHAQNNAEPQESNANALELLFTGERVYVIDRNELHEFEEVL